MGYQKMQSLIEDLTTNTTAIAKAEQAIATAQSNLIAISAELAAMAESAISQDFKIYKTIDRYHWQGLGRYAAHYSANGFTTEREAIDSAEEFVEEFDFSDCCV
jgi:hypothetical protein